MQPKTERSLPLPCELWCRVGKVRRMLAACQPFIQRLPRYPQEPGGHALIAIGAAQHLSNQRLLGFFERRKLLRKPRGERRSWLLGRRGHGVLRLTGNG